MFLQLPTSIADTFLYVNYLYYDTRKSLCFQVKYPAVSYNIVVFSIKGAVYENLLRSLAFIGSSCYTHGDIQVVVLLVDCCLHLWLPAQVTQAQVQL